MTIWSDYPQMTRGDFGFVVVEQESGFALTDDALRRQRRVIGRLLRARGLTRGDVVVVVARGGVGTVAVVLALLDAGLVAVPTNPAYAESELDHVLSDSGARLVIETDDGTPSEALSQVIGRLDIPLISTAAVIAEAAAVIENDANNAPADDTDADAAHVEDTDDAHADDVALLIYTSGTTGRSKGCAHTRRDLRAGIGALMQLWAIGPDDVVINPLPLFHVHGLCVCLLGALWHGARVILIDRFTPAAIVDAVRAGGNVLMTVPTMIHRLLAHFEHAGADADVIGRLRLVTCGSAALSASQLVAFRDRTGLTILERYGMSETLITLSNPLVGERVAGAVGRPVPGTVIRVIDDELQVRSAGMMKGYWNRADADAEAFVVDEQGQRWFRTGDAVVVDNDGVVRLVGRLSQDILKVGGFKLSTREIEEAIASHNDVVEVAVIGLPDPEWGETVCAVVVVAPGAALTLEIVRAHVQLGPMKKPRRLIVVAALPRNALGKVQKHVLKDLARREQT